MKTRSLLAVCFIMLAAAQARSQEDRPSSAWPQRGPIGLFDWRTTKTVPPVPYPSIPRATAENTCLVAPDGKYPPAGVVAAVAPDFDWHKLTGFVAAGLVVGTVVGAAGTFRGLTKNRVPASVKK